jgi:hypothetical protein
VNIGAGERGLILSGSGYGEISYFCVYGGEPSVSIKCGEFL